MPSYNLCKFIYGISFRSGIVRSKGTLCTFLTCIVTLNFKKLYQFILPPTVFLRKLLLPTSLASYPVIPQVHTFNTILSNYLISATERKQASTTTKKTQIIPCIFSDCKVMKLEVNHKKKSERPQIFEG